MARRNYSNWYVMPRGALELGTASKYLASEGPSTDYFVTDAELVQFNHESARSRIRSISFLLLVAFAVEYGVEGGAAPLGVSLWGLTGPCVIGLLLSFAVLSGSWNHRAPWSAYYIQMAVDLIILTAGIHASASGPAAIAARIIYVTIIVPPNLISLRSGIVATVGAILSHLVLIALEYGVAVESFFAGAPIVPVVSFILVALMASAYGGYIGESNGKLLQLAENLEHSRTRLASLLNLAQSLNSSSEAEDLFALVNTSALREFRADWCATYRVDMGRGVLTLATASDGGRVAAPPELAIAEWPYFERMARDAVIFLGPEDEPIDWLPCPDGLSTFVLAGLIRRGEPLGFLVLGYRGDRPSFNEVEIEQISAVAEHATSALHNVQLLEEAREASAMKSEFLSTVSHELRTPLNVILGYASILHEEGVGPLNAEQRDLFERIDAQARDLNELIESVLRVGQIENGRDQVVSTLVDVGRLRSTIATSVENLPCPEGVRLCWRGGENLCGEIETDESKVALVVRNLIGNAFKFTNEGEVVVTFEADEEELMINVADSGPGIAEEQMPRIFEMFRQAERDPGAPHPKGVGLGLYIVDQTVRRLGGTIEVSSELGVGTTFSVRLGGFVSLGTGRAALAASA